MAGLLHLTKDRNHGAHRRSPSPQFRHDRLHDGTSHIPNTETQGATSSASFIDHSATSAVTEYAAMGHGSSHVQAGLAVQSDVGAGMQVGGGELEDSHSTRALAAVMSSADRCHELATDSDGSLSTSVRLKTLQADSTVTLNNPAEDSAPYPLQGTNNTLESERLGEFDVNNRTVPSDPGDGSDFSQTSPRINRSNFSLVGYQGEERVPVSRGDSIASEESPARSEVSSHHVESGTDDVSQHAARDGQSSDGHIEDTSSFSSSYSPPRLRASSGVPRDGSFSGFQRRHNVKKVRTSSRLGSNASLMSAGGDDQRSSTGVSGKTQSGGDSSEVASHMLGNAPSPKLSSREQARDIAVARAKERRAQAATATDPTGARKSDINSLSTTRDRKKRLSSRRPGKARANSVREANQVSTIHHSYLLHSAL